MKCMYCGATWADELEVTTCATCGHPLTPESEVEVAYHGAMLAESETRYEDAMELYAKAADGGIINAPYDICRCLKKSGQSKSRENHYAFWLGVAAGRSSRDAYRYSCYLKKLGDEAGSLTQLKVSAEGGHPMAVLSLALICWRQGKLPEARYYLAKTAGSDWRAKTLLFLLGANKEKAELFLPVKPELYAEAYNKGSYAEKLGIPVIAKAYYELSAEGDYAPALERLADICMQGDRDELAAEGYLTRLGEGGNADAYVDLADYYKNGLIGGKPDPHRAYEIYLLAAKLGDSRAMVLVGDACMDGEGTACNPYLALSWYDKAAAVGNLLGDARAKETRARGDRLYQEAVVAMSHGETKEAVDLYQQAAELGNADAACAIGDAYLAARGVERSYKLAARWYEFAIHLGKEIAKYRLGVLYSNNLGVRFDAAKAESLLRDALAVGCKQAEGEILKLKQRRNARLHRKVYSTACVIYRRGDKLEALKFLVVATKMGNGRAAYLLGCMFECGDAVPKDPLRASKYFDRARELGFDGKGNRYLGKFIRNLKK